MTIKDRQAAEGDDRNHTYSKKISIFACCERLLWVSVAFLCSPANIELFTYASSALFLVYQMSDRAVDFEVFWWAAKHCRSNTFAPKAKPLVLLQIFSYVTQCCLVSSKVTLCLVCFLSRTEDSAAADDCDKQEEYDFSRPFLFSDMFLDVGDQQLHCHRAILSLYSPFFKAMFENKFQVISLFSDYLLLASLVLPSSF